MSILWGVLENRDSVIDPHELKRMALPTARFASGEAIVKTQGRIGMGMQLIRTANRRAPKPDLL
jgi:hypothetical protein